MIISPTIPNTKVSKHKLNVKGFEISGTSLRLTIRKKSPRKKADHFTLILF